VTARHLLAVLGAVLALLGCPSTAAAAPPPAPSGTWSWPLAGRPAVTRWFEPPAGPYAAGHRGVDLAGAAGAPVLSAADGVVAFAGMVAGRPVVSVDHPGGLRTTYEPVQAVLAAGRAVARGAPLGMLLPGHAGCPVAACLHWGLRRGDDYLDPMALLGPREVRLLPVWSAPAGLPASGPAAAPASPWARVDPPSRSPAAPAGGAPGVPLAPATALLAGLAGGFATASGSLRRRAPPGPRRRTACWAP
jgi:murein DD-endopeptidase MepM/ murein hydrolase activator NlpD